MWASRGDNKHVVQRTKLRDTTAVLNVAATLSISPTTAVDRNVVTATVFHHCSGWDTAVVVGCFLST